MVRFFNKWKPLPTTPYQKLIPSLPPEVTVARKPRRVNDLYFKGNAGRLIIIGRHITQLIKFERIETTLHRGEEVQGYVERLIAEAIRYGDKHIPTMELADFYIHEKQLIPKLFKVLVPRYCEYTGAYTKLWCLSQEIDPSDVNKHLHYVKRGVLELKGNPLPPIVGTRNTSKKYYLTNILLNAAKNDFYNSKQIEALQSKKPES